MTDHSFLPEIIASLNALSLVLLIAGGVAIRQKKILVHRVLMVTAVLSSAAFLTVYLIHHYQVGSVAYPRQDWTRLLYFFILIPHIILAVAILPLVFLALKHAVKNEIEKHKKVVRFLYPTWLYVSVTGIIVYFMLYRLT